MPVNVTAAEGQALFDLAKLTVEVAADFGLDFGRIGAGLDSASPSQALGSSAPDTHDTRTGTGLREDQVRRHRGARRAAACLTLLAR